VALGGEIDDGVRAVLGQKPGHQLAVTDVATHEHVVRMVGDFSQRLQVAGVGERIQVDDAHAAARQRREDEIGADETGAAGDQPGSLHWGIRELNASCAELVLPRREVDHAALS